MSKIGENIGFALGKVIRGTAKGVTGVAKGAATVVVGSVGVASKIVGVASESASEEMAKGFSNIGDNCFGTVKWIWTGEKTERKKIGFDSYIINDAMVRSLDKMYRNRYDAIHDREKRKEIAEKWKLPPEVVDDPKFIEFLERKYLN